MSNPTDRPRPVIQLPPGLGAFQSRIVAPTAEEMLSKAIAQTLSAVPGERASLFERLTKAIADIVALNPAMRAWTVAVHRGTDGSTVFRGGIGHSLVIDPQGRLWRARTYEDFQTTYVITLNTCEIDTMTPNFTQLREYLPRV
ncbi:MAG: hypothetical protein ABI837_11435 [Acidobacteriota bacterium]